MILNKRNKALNNIWTNSGAYHVYIMGCAIITYYTAGHASHQGYVKVRLDSKTVTHILSHCFTKNYE